MRARRVSFLALVLPVLSIAASAALAAPGPLGPEFPAENLPIPEESWWSTCVGADGVRSTIVPTCTGDECPAIDDLFLERRDNAGVLLAPPLKLNEGAAIRALFRLSCHPAGWVVAQWQDDETACYVHRLIEPDGDAVAAPLRTVLPGNDCRARASIAVRSDGTFLATWAAAYLNGGSGVVVQAYGANAEPLGEALTMTDAEVGWNRLPKIAVDEANHALVAWSGDSHGEGPQPVYARFLDTTTDPLGDTIRLDSFAYGQNAPPAVTSEADGTFTVTWSNPILGGRIARRVGLSAPATTAAEASAVGHTPAELPHFGAVRIVDSEQVASFDFSAHMSTLACAGDSTWILRDDDGAIRQSLDHGATWSPLGSPGESTLAVGALATANVVILRRANDRVESLRSSDGGATWSEANKVATIAADAVGCMNCRVVDADVEGSGEAWIAAWAVRDRVRSTKASPWRIVQRITIARSFDGGKTWGAVAEIDAAPGVAENGFDLHTDGAGVWVLAWIDESLHVARSIDDGRHWMPPVTIATDVACVECAVSRRASRLEISHDGVGAWAMAFAAARYRTATYGYDGDVFVSRSTNAGLTWSEPAPLATYAPTDASRELAPTIATNGDGRWVAAWTSHRPLGNGDTADPDVVTAMSTDGGATWSAPVPARAKLVGELTLDGSPLLAVDANGVWMSAWQSVSYDDADGLSTESIFAAAGDAECGNGDVEPGEHCDENDAKNGDGCDRNCTETACGNGIVTRREECDDGNQRDDDTCSSDCRAAYCGDGFVNQPDEECDDGNDANDDECPSSCRLASCGDGEHDLLVEECDDGNGLNNDDCVEGCKPARCGDGFVQDYVEACDDGNDIDDDACPNACDRATCGDGHTSVGFEPCDPEDPAYAQVCSETCRLIDLCGDADGDGTVSVSDVQRILLKGIGLTARCPREICDMDSSGAVRVGDAQLGVAIAVGLDVGDRCSIGTGNIVFWIDYVGDIGALQVEAGYGGTGGEFVGSADEVDCEPLLEGLVVSEVPDDYSGGGIDAFVTFNDAEDTRTLHAAMVSLPGFSGPMDLFRCAFVLPADRQSARFELKTVDAADTELAPISPMPLFGYRLE